MSLSLDRLHFLAGHWSGALDDGFIEEMWLAPSGGVVQATVRLVVAGRVDTIELIVVAAEGRRVVMRYNHFRPDHTTWEKDGPIVLTLSKAREGEVVFSNMERPMHRAAEMTYRLLDANTLHSSVVALSEDGTRTRHSFEFRRVTQ